MQSKANVGKKWRRLPREESATKPKGNISGLKRDGKEKDEDECVDMEMEMEHVAKRRGIEPPEDEAQRNSVTSNVAGPTQWALSQP